MQQKKYDCYNFCSNVKAVLVLSGPRNSERNKKAEKNNKFMIKRANTCTIM